MTNSKSQFIKDKIRLFLIALAILLVPVFVGVIMLGGLPLYAVVSIVVPLGIGLLYLAKHFGLKD